jgi:hypothetical protein
MAGENRSDIPELLQEPSEVQSHESWPRPQRITFPLSVNADSLPSSETSKPPIVLPVHTEGGVSPRLRLKALLPKVLKAVPECQVVHHTFFQCDGENRADIPELLKQLSEVQSHTRLKPIPCTPKD